MSPSFISEINVGSSQAQVECPVLVPPRQGQPGTLALALPVAPCLPRTWPPGQPARVPGPPRCLLARVDAGAQ